MSYDYYEDDDFSDLYEDECENNDSGYELYYNESYPESYYDELDFQEPNGKSALRAASSTNPRNLPCPTCNEPNRLTVADKGLGYQCNECAELDELNF